MIEKNKIIKNKIINHLQTNGNKKTCENILLKSFKNIQKYSKKSHKKIVKLAILNATPLFRIATLKNNKNKKKSKSKEIPTYINNKSRRTTWALKYISNASKTQNLNQSYDKLKQEIIETSKNSSKAIKQKVEKNENASTKKQLFEYYKW